MMGAICRIVHPTNASKTAVIDGFHQCILMLHTEIPRCCCLLSMKFRTGHLKHSHKFSDKWLPAWSALVVKIENHFCWICHVSRVLVPLSQMPETSRLNWNFCKSILTELAQNRNICLVL